MMRVQENKKQKRTKKAVAVAIIPLLFMGMGFSGVNGNNESAKALHEETVKQTAVKQVMVSAPVQPAMAEKPAVKPVEKHIVVAKENAQTTKTQPAANVAMESVVWDELEDDMVPLAIMPNGVYAVVETTKAPQSVTVANVEETVIPVELDGNIEQITESANNSLQATEAALQALEDAKVQKAEADEHLEAANVVLETAKAELEQAKEAEQLAGEALAQAETKLEAAKETLLNAEDAKANTAAALAEAQDNKINAEQALAEAQAKVAELEATIAQNEATLAAVQETVSTAEATVKNAESNYIREFEFLIALNDKMHEEGITWTDVIAKNDSSIDSNGALSKIDTTNAAKVVDAQKAVQEVNAYVQEEHSDLTEDGVYWKLYHYNDSQYKKQETAYALTLALGELPTKSCSSSDVTAIRFRPEDMKNYGQYNEAGFDVRENIGFNSNGSVVSTNGTQFKDGTTITLEKAEKAIAEYHAAKDTLAAAQAQQETIQQNQMDLAGELQEATEEVTVAEENVQTADIALEAATNADAEALQAVEEAQTEVVEAEAEVAVAEEAVQTAETVVEAAEADVAEAEIAVEVAEAVVAEADAAVAEAEAAVNE